MKTKLTITGPSGCGKTKLIKAISARLALQGYDEFEFVETIQRGTEIQITIHGSCGLIDLMNAFEGIKKRGGYPGEESGANEMIKHYKGLTDEQLNNLIRD